MVDVRRPHVKGDHANLNRTNPTASRTKARDKIGLLVPCIAIASAITDKRVLPARPKSREMPYNKMPDEKAPNTKYLADASSERASVRLSPAIT